MPVAKVAAPEYIFKKCYCTIQIVLHQASALKKNIILVHQLNDLVCATVMLKRSTGGFVCF